MKRMTKVLDVNGFGVIVEFWSNHISVKLPEEMIRPAERGAKHDIELTMEDICRAFSRHFELVEHDGRTCLSYHRNDGIEHHGRGKSIEIVETAPRKARMSIRGHEIRATISADSTNILSILLPEKGIGNDFTFHDLCLAISHEFVIYRSKKSRRTRIRCLR